jgi:hypothetical protein
MHIIALHWTKKIPAKPDNLRVFDVLCISLDAREATEQSSTSHIIKGFVNFVF